jgi:hypothetical protein
LQRVEAREKAMDVATRWKNHNGRLDREISGLVHHVITTRDHPATGASATGVGISR